MDTQLTDKAVVITGAATGIGRATALAFAKEGAKLALLDIDAGELARTVELCNGTATAVVADLSSERGVTDGVAAAIAALDGHVDVLFNNVGSGAVRAFDDLDDDAWHRTFELNFFSQVRAIRAVLPIMRQQGHGAIVNNASDLARQPEAVPIDYSVSKAAVLALTKALARSEGPAIRVNTVAPGPIWSEFWTKPGGFAETMAAHHGLPPMEAVEHEMKQRQLPLQRLGTPDEVANVVIMLASPLTAYVTGSVWGVDGGSIRGLT